MALCSLFLGSRRDPQEEEGAALALCAARDLGRCRGARAVRVWRQGGSLRPAPGSSLQPGWHAAPAHPGKQAWPGGPQPAGSSAEAVSPAEGPRLGLGDKAASSPRTHLQPPLHPARGKAEPSTHAPAPEQGSPAPGPASSHATLLLCPLQDLLALLHEHGPSTEGIFRLAAGERASRELREALDSGAEVHLESQPAHLLAVILKVNPPDLEPSSSRLCRCRRCCLRSRRQWSKPHPEPLALQDFLRKIPSKLLQAELYEEWMSALHKTSRQERLAGLKE